MDERRDVGEVEHATAVSPVALDPTGIRGFDEVLGGGLQRGALMILVGPPGSGKTIMASQIAFHAASQGRCALILTAFSEATNKLIAHLSGFSFFDRELLGHVLACMSLTQFLDGGMEDAADHIFRSARQLKAKLVVIDGFRGIRDVAEQPQVARQFIYEVSNKLSLLGATTIITSEAEAHDPAFIPEATMADNIVGMNLDIVGTQERRNLEVIKVRGAAPFSGLHTLAIDEDGVSVYPRLEVRVSRLAAISQQASGETTPDESNGAGRAESGHSRGEKRRAPATGSAVASASVAGAGRPAPSWRHLEARLSTGVPDLDQLLGGGIMRSTSTLVIGNLGVGKTLLGMQFALESVRAGEPAVFLGFRETPEQLVFRSHAFGWGNEFEQAVASGQLTLVRWPPVELRPDILADQLFSLIDQTHARRLVLDGVFEIEHAIVEQEYSRCVHGYLAALVEAVRLRGVTALYTHDMPGLVQSSPDVAHEPMSMLVGNVLWLRKQLIGAHLHRSVAVLQTRFSAHDPTIYAFSIDAPHGIQLLRPFDSGHVDQGAGPDTPLDQSEARS